jgi:hypothetical protein
MSAFYFIGSSILFVCWVSLIMYRFPKLRTDNETHEVYDFKASMIMMMTIFTSIMVTNKVQSLGFPSLSGISLIFTFHVGFIALIIMKVASYKNKEALNISCASGMLFLVVIIVLAILSVIFGS